MLVPTNTTLTCEPCREGGPLAHAAVNLIGLDAPQRAARRIVRKALAGKTNEECTDDVELVADELVGNALQHAGAALGISLDVYKWGVAVQVRDGGEDTQAVPKRPSPADDDAENGRGMLLVDLLASAWSVQRDGEGKRIVAIFLYRADDADR